MYPPPAPDGRELCLRPDLTIPVSRDYLASPAAGKPAGFCYLGPVFRYRPNAPGEFAQGGIEATWHSGIEEPDLRRGDIGLFAAGVGAPGLAPAWKRRLVKDFNRAGSLR